MMHQRRDNPQNIGRICMVLDIPLKARGKNIKQIDDVLERKDNQFLGRTITNGRLGLMDIEMGLVELLYVQHCL
jgi:hypothetical protein